MNMSRPVSAATARDRLNWEIGHEALSWEDKSRRDDVRGIPVSYRDWFGRFRLVGIGREHGAIDPGAHRRRTPFQSAFRGRGPRGRLLLGRTGRLSTREGN